MQHETKESAIAHLESYGGFIWEDESGWNTADSLDFLSNRIEDSTREHTDSFIAEITFPVDSTPLESWRYDSIIFEDGSRRIYRSSYARFDEIKTLWSLGASAISIRRKE